MIHSGLHAPQSVQHDINLLGQIAELAGPGAEVAVAQAVARDKAKSILPTKEKFLDTMRLAGLSNIVSCDLIEPEDRAEIAEHLGLKSGDEFDVYRVNCSMPDFAVGSSAKLSFADKVAEKRKAKEAAAAVAPAAKAAVWSIDDVDDDEVELVDQDNLLDEEDLAKPDPATLRGGRIRITCA